MCMQTHEPNTCGLWYFLTWVKKTWVVYGAVFPIGSVRFGAVNRNEPHRSISALFKTEPHRTVSYTILENRTEPHRRA